LSRRNEAVLLVEGRGACRGGCGCGGGRVSERRRGARAQLARRDTPGEARLASEDTCALLLLLLLSGPTGRERSGCRGRDVKAPTDWCVVVVEVGGRAGERVKRSLMLLTCRSNKEKNNWKRQATSSEAGESSGVVESTRQQKKEKKKSRHRERVCCLTRAPSLSGWRTWFPGSTAGKKASEDESTSEREREGTSSLL
jgi:hypothetical protein